ncbi:hypothetical protein IMSAGC011_02267 [Lachnospiraceae bacterium]|nr:hypothetical protein IMSAGC011_02267 [Lachnospiraceae bacterium]
MIALENADFVEKDLYYAIHCYTFDVQKHIFTLTDRYDYAFSDECTSVAGVVNEMFLVQQNGVLVPYYVKIVTH